MVISHIQPLLLLACLFFLPALHAVDFQYCKGVVYPSFDITRMEFSPDATTLTIFGSANRVLSNLDVDVARKFGELIIPIVSFDFCKLVKCPILPRNDFILTIPEVPPKLFEHQTLSVIWTTRTEGPRADIVMCVDLDYPTSVVSA